MNSMKSLKQALAEMQEKIKVDGPSNVTHMPQSKPKCQMCGDIGYYKVAVPYGHRDFGRFLLCDAKGCEAGTKARERRWNKWMKNSGLPPKYAQFTFDTWKQTLKPEELKGKQLAYAMAELLAFADPDMGNADHYVSIADGYRYWQMEPPKELWKQEKRNSLVLHGDYGMGKTGLAAAIANHQIDYHGSSTLYVRTDDFLNSVRSTYNSQNNSDNHDGPTDEDVINLARTAPLLILDEFYIQKISDFARTTVENVIRYRHSHALPTVITCNQSADELTASWGQATVDVILAMANWITMGGLKLRKTNPPVDSF